MRPEEKKKKAEKKGRTLKKGWYHVKRLWHVEVHDLLTRTCLTFSLKGRCRGFFESSTFSRTSQNTSSYIHLTFSLEQHISQLSHCSFIPSSHNQSSLHLQPPQPQLPSAKPLSLPSPPPFACRKPTPGFSGLGYEGMHHNQR
jgi:hypothetical protein